MAAQINLYDASLRRVRRLLTLASLVAVAIGLTLLIAVAGVLERDRLPPLAAESQRLDEQAKQLQEQMVVLGREAAERQPDAVLAERLALARVSLQTRERVLELLRRDLAPEAASWSELLRALARARSEGVWLTGVQAQADGGLEIRGRALDAALLPGYLARLNGEGPLRGRGFAALDIKAGKPEKKAATGTLPADEGKPPFVEFTLVPQAAPGREKKS